MNQLTIRHTQNGPYRFDSEAAPALLAYANSSAKPVEDTIRRATATMLSDKPVTDRSLLETVSDYCAKHGKFTKSEIKSAIDFSKAEEGDCRTLLVQGNGLRSRISGRQVAECGSILKFKTPAGRKSARILNETTLEHPLSVSPVNHRTNRKLQRGRHGDRNHRAGRAVANEQKGESEMSESKRAWVNLGPDNG